MIAPVRNAYARRAGSRVAAGARNIAKVSDTPFIETAAESKRTGAQEESLLREGAERADEAAAADEPEHAAGQGVRRTQLADLVDHSLAWNERLRAAAKAYRYTIEKLDKTQHRSKPGEVYDSPF